MIEEKKDSCASNGYKKINRRDVYDTYVRLIIQAESISWNRFNSFLILNSILILAWAGIFTSDSPSSTSAKFVMALICLLGGLSGIAWAILGRRGRKYLDKYKEQAKTIEEKRPDWWEKCIEYDDKPIGISIPYTTKVGTSTWLLYRGPQLFTLMYIALLAVTFSRELCSLCYALCS